MNCKYYKPEMSTLLLLCKQLYSLPGCGAGGCLHILLDDNNYDDHSLAFCREYCEKNAEGKERITAMRILDIYSSLSIKERVLFDNLWNGYVIECHNPVNCDKCELIEIPWWIEEATHE